MKVELSYQVDGAGPALYLVHGIGARKSVWDALVAGLQDHFTCVRFDLRGHGASAAPALPYSLDDLVGDLESLRAHLGHEKIHVFGHSLGGMVAPAFARAHPSRVLSLGLLSTAAARDADDRARLAAVRQAMRERGIVQMLDALVSRWFTDAFIAANPRAVEARKQQVLDTPAEVFLNVFDIYAETEMIGWLHEIDAPCLVMTGELDGACTPKLNQLMHAELAHSELVILPEVKHAILLEAPGVVLRYVREFLFRVN